METVAEFREGILNYCDFEKVAQTHLFTICDENEEERREQVLSMAKMFGDMLDLMGESGSKDVEEIKL